MDIKNTSCCDFGSPILGAPHRGSTIPLMRQRDAEHILHIEVIKTDAILDNVLESFLMIICFIFLGLAIMFAIEALHKRKGSYIMKTLTIDPETGKGKKSARIITLTLGILGLAAGIYFSLSYFGLPVYVFHFPIMLVTCMMNWGYMIAIIGIYFFFYPEIYIKAYSY